MKPALLSIWILIALSACWPGSAPPACPDAATDDAGLPVACATVDASALLDGSTPDIGKP